MATTGSMPCQNRWLGSISAPTWVASISVARRSMVRRVVDEVVRVHLDADLDVGVGGPGLDVLPERDRRPRSTGSRGRRGRRCARARPSTTGSVAPASEPGRPDMVTTRLTPSSAASSIESRTSLACRGPTAGLGSSGLPLQLRAVRVTPAGLNSPRYSSRASWLVRMSSIGRWTGGRNPPELISALSSPRLAQGLEGLAERAGRAGRRCRHRASCRRVLSVSRWVDVGAAGLGRGDDRVQQAQVVQAVGERGAAAGAPRARRPARGRPGPGRRTGRSARSRRRGSPSAARR